MTPRSQLTAGQDVKRVAIKELLDLGHVHIGVAATVYTRVRLRLQRDTIDLLGCALGRSSEAATEPDEADEPPLRAAPVR